MLLWAEPPDRLHAEVLSPLGAPQLIVDGGGGELAVTFVPDGLSFLGRAGAESLEPVLGLPVGVDGLVGALREGTAPGGDVRVSRTGRSTPGLPERLRLEASGASLELELRDLRPLGVDPDRLGTGRAPEGSRIRPLSELSDEASRAEQLTQERAEP